jgi:hypothetical protein
MSLNECLLVRVAVIFWKAVVQLRLTLVFPIEFILNVRANDLDAQVSWCFANYIFENVLICYTRQIWVKDVVRRYHVNGHLHKSWDVVIRKDLLLLLPPRVIDLTSEIMIS